MSTPQTYAAALAAGKPSPDTWHAAADWRAAEAERARRCVSDRSGASYGFIEPSCWLICEQGAALEDLRRKVAAFLAQWDRPGITLRGGAADLEETVQALRGDA
jgi:hypothetical protein